MCITSRLHACTHARLSTALFCFAVFFSSFHLLTTATDVKEVGRLTAVELDDIHGGHGKTGTVDYYFFFTLLAFRKKKGA